MGTPDPAIYRTAAGAQQMAAGVLPLFRTAFAKYVVASGTFTDELTTKSGVGAGTLDKRKLEAENDQTVDETGAYALLQNARVHADLVARSLVAYAPTVDPTLRARMYAIQGYTEVLLADLFCSGIPLTTLNLDQGGFVYRAGTPRDSVYLHAITLFDSTLALVSSNDSLLTLARVGKGRALLALGRFAEAAQAVAAVSDGSRYQLYVVLGGAVDGTTAPTDLLPAQASDQEGQVGLAYRSSHDPRTLSVRLNNGNPDSVKYAPAKYVLSSQSKGDSVPVVLADGIEARLVRAEVALQQNDVATWIATLNGLRATAAVPPVRSPSDAGAYTLDTPVPLIPLVTPNTTAARRDTLFAERAAWLYLTGHRQGDLRRLLRSPYSVAPGRAYPSGAYPGGDSYGSAVTAPIPGTERANQQFKGCIDRNP